MSHTHYIYMTAWKYVWSDEWKEDYFENYQDADTYITELSQTWDHNCKEFKEIVAIPVHGAGFFDAEDEND